MCKNNIAIFDIVEIAKRLFPKETEGKTVDEVYAWLTLTHNHAILREVNSKLFVYKLTKAFNWHKGDL